MGNPINAALAVHVSSGRSHIPNQLNYNWEPLSQFLKEETSSLFKTLQSDLV